MAPKLPYYVIESGRPGFVFLQPKNDPRYADLVRQEKDGSLERLPGVNAMPRAAAKMTTDMLYEEYTDPETFRTSLRFKDSVKVAEADSRGRIFIEKDQPELARECLRILRNLDKSVQLDPEGFMLPEELPEGVVRNKGGRPRKQQ